MASCSISDAQFLAPPAVTALRQEARSVDPKSPAMVRSLSDDMRREREDLKQAAEQTMNVIVDLDLDSRIKWVSPSWRQVIGTQPESVEGRLISDIVVDNKNVFRDTVESMKEDDSRSRFIRFSVYTGPHSALKPSSDPCTTGPDRGTSEENVTEKSAETPEAESESHCNFLNMEAQGIMVFDHLAGGDSHTMWMLRPFTEPREVTIDLPPLLMESLGVGAEVLANYLTTLADVAAHEPDQSKHPAPTPILCRICERQITPWWFEKHSDLCLQEHQAEMDVQIAQENLNEHRNLIVKVLDALEARQSRPLTGDGSPTPMPRPEYKGLPIGPSSASSTSSSGAASSSSSTLGTPPRSRDHSLSSIGHVRGRSFAVRRPLTRIVELVLDLCDTALEINMPLIKDCRPDNGEDFRTLSPQSESRISQVLQWQSPSSNTLDQERGLAVLSADTEQVAKAKVDMVYRYRKIIEYAERIRIEYTALVEECITAALNKAERIAAGQLSDSSEGDLVEESTFRLQQGESQEPLAPLSALTASMRNSPESHQTPAVDTRGSSTAVSTGSSSPMECPTPRSHKSAAGLLGTSQPSRRSHLFTDIDAGEVSDNSVFSPSVSGAVRTESPSSERSFDKKRTGLILPGLPISPRRQHSPARLSGPRSPLRMPKPRLSIGADSLPSPMASPSTVSGELAYSYHRHHRRQSSSSDVTKPPISPRLSSANQPQPRPAPPSIKDFEIIKPISKGAFGSVYLSKKKVTGEYFAIKVLKKADMVAKNQVTNVKAERAIMMWQGESDFVAKLYWTFSSKDYLYLVMEYLNGGDCASLVKVLGGLPEDWAKRYIAEVVLGVEHMHERGIVHRDLKPDNLLIDQAGHLKLTDFGLSRMGLVGRQKRVLKGLNEAVPDLLKHGPFPRAASIASSRSASFDFQGSFSPVSTPLMAPDTVSGVNQPSYFNLNQGGLSRQSSRRASGHRSDSLGSDTVNTALRTLPASETGEGHSQLQGSLIEEETQYELGESPYLLPVQPSASSLSSHGASQPQQQPMIPPLMALFDPEDQSRRFVGTPDYLAPETVNGVGQDEMGDWWSLGCIMFEFLFGYPPFNSSTPDEVFENILNRRINWPDEPEELASPEAIDLMNKLMTINPRERLGANTKEEYANGGAEIRSHPWFSDINWDTLLEDKAQFVPNLENPEDTDYFDSRGATLQTFDEESEEETQHLPASTAVATDRPHDALFKVRSQGASIKRPLMPLHIPPHVRDSRSRRLSEPAMADDFGNFTFKNLPMLEKANKDVIQKLRQETMQSQQRQSTSATAHGQSSLPASGAVQECNSISIQTHRAVPQCKGHNRPSSPSNLSQANSSPSRLSQPSSPLLVQFSTGYNHERRKTSGSSSTNSYQSSGSFPPPYADQGRLTNLKFTSVASSPIKLVRGAQSPDKMFPGQRSSGDAVTRTRSQTIGSQDGDILSAAKEPFVPGHYKRRNQLFDISPSSSDNEDPRTKALLKVQRRRQSTRRLSQINILEGPFFRPLDVLICEDHPVSRLVLERLFEKLRCRTITAADGTEAMRYALSDVQFDIITTEFKLPQVNGADFARMVRETRSTNRHTPIIAVTSYLKDLPENHPFDSLVEKPPTLAKLTEALCKFCQWKPPTKDYHPSQLTQVLPSALRYSPLNAGGSPSSTSSGFANAPPSLWRGSSRQDSAGSSYFDDLESAKADDASININRQPEERRDSQGEVENSSDSVFPPSMTQLKPSAPSVLVRCLPATTSAPPDVSALTVTPRRQQSSEAIRAKRESLEKKRYECGESGDDEDEELGSIQPRALSPHSSKPCRAGSKLGIEMMRTNSRGSVVSGSEEVPRKDREAMTTIPCDDLSDINKNEGSGLAPAYNIDLEDKFEGFRIADGSIVNPITSDAISEKPLPSAKELSSDSSSLFSLQQSWRPAIYQRDTKIFSPIVPLGPLDKSEDLDEDRSTAPPKVTGPEYPSPIPDYEASPRPFQLPVTTPTLETLPPDEGERHADP